MRYLAPALCLLLVGTACEEDIVTQIDPFLEVTPEHIDFGTVELGQQNVETVTIRNIESVRGEIRELSIEDDCDGCFLVVNPTDEVMGYETYELQVRFRAVRLQIATATLTIASDDPRAPVHEITMVGRGIDTRKPCIEVVPQAVDFGFVPSGGIAVRSFVVRSCGTNDLLIDRIRIAPEDAPFRVTTSTPSPAMPGVLPPGDQASVSLRAELPEATTGTITGSVIIETNVIEELNVSGETGWVEVPLTALGNLPPVAVPGEDQNVEPWSRVTLDGSMSYDQDDPPDEPLTYFWTMVSKPDGSTTVLERASTAMPSFWADLTGTYELQLVVTDSLGLESAPELVVVEALPTNAIRIELTWDHPDSDVDLHLLQEGGTFCDCATDTHYRDCGREPNWFPATPGANPRLDVDDRSGFGPENINVDGHGPSRFIPDGRYTIAAHYFASNSEVSTWPTSVSVVTIRVYVFGLLAGELSHELVSAGDLWIAGQIEWPSGQIIPDGSVVGGAICGAF